MNQPTDDRLKRIEEKQEDFDKRLKEVERQQTEPIRITRLEIDQGGIQESLVQVNKRLDSVQEDVTVLKEDVVVLKEDVTVLKIEMQGARADILQIRESQADLRDKLIEHSEDLKVIKDKQDAHSELLEQLINIGEETKTSQAGHSKRFDRLETMMMQVLNRLPQPGGE